MKLFEGKGMLGGFVKTLMQPSEKIMEWATTAFPNNKISGGAKKHRKTRKRNNHKRKTHRKRV